MSCAEVTNNSSNFVEPFGDLPNHGSIILAPIVGVKGTALRICGIRLPSVLLEEVSNTQDGVRDQKEIRFLPEVGNRKFFIA